MHRPPRYYKDITNSMWSKADSTNQVMSIQIFSKWQAVKASKLCCLSSVSCCLVLGLNLSCLRRKRSRFHVYFGKLISTSGNHLIADLFVWENLYKYHNSGVIHKVLPWQQIHNQSWLLQHLRSADFLSNNSCLRYKLRYVGWLRSRESFVLVNFMAITCAAPSCISWMMTMQTHLEFQNSRYYHREEFLLFYGSDWTHWYTEFHWK